MIQRTTVGVPTAIPVYRFSTAYRIVRIPDNGQSACMACMRQMIPIEVRLQ